MLRSTHNRRVDTTARYLWETVRAQPVRNTFRLSVRRAPDESCETALERAEWQALYASHWATTQVPSMPPTLHEAVRWIAQLGGFLGRRSDGEPGVKTL